MKNFKNRILAGVLTAVMAVSAFAGTTSVEAASLSAKQYLSKMTRASEKAKSYEAKTTMDMDMTMQGQTASTKTTTTSIAFTNPVKVKSVMNMSISTGGETTKSKVISYSKQKGDKLLQYTSSDGKTYEKSTIDLSEYSDTLASLQATDMYSSLEITDNNATVNGKSTVAIKATIKGKDIADLLAQLGIGSNEPDGTSYDYSSLAPITCNIWIDKKTYYPVKQTIDMLDFMNGYLAALGMDSDMSYSKIKTTTTYKNFNKATKFSIPKACK